jgi:hypothetical protein
VESESSDSQIPDRRNEIMSLPAKDNTAMVGRTQMTTKVKRATPALTAVRQITVGKDLPNRDSRLR